MFTLFFYPYNKSPAKLTLHVRPGASVLHAYQPPACRRYQRHRAVCSWAPRTVRTRYAYQPRACRTYRVPWHHRSPVVGLALSIAFQLGMLLAAYNTEVALVGLR